MENEWLRRTPSREPIEAPSRSQNNDELSVLVASEWCIVNHKKSLFASGTKSGKTMTWMIRSK